MVKKQGIEDALGSPARLCHRNSESRTSVAKRISGRGETDPERAHQGSAAAFRREKGDTGRDRSPPGRMALEEAAATAKPDTILGWFRARGRPASSVHRAARTRVRWLSCVVTYASWEPSGDMAILMPRSLYRCLGLKSDPYGLTWLDGLQGNESVPEVRQQVFQAN